jgi:hypothetical protein
MASLAMEAIVNTKPANPTEAVAFFFAEGLRGARSLNSSHRLATLAILDGDGDL